MRRATIGCAFFVLVMAQATVAGGALLNLEFPHYPRVWGISMGVSYDLPDNPSPEDTRLFRAVGYTAEQYDSAIMDPNNPVLLDGDFTLEAVLRQDGTFVSGTLLVNGDYMDPDNTVLFSSGALTAFGYGGDDLFEFTFTQQGNGLAPDGETVGIILSAVSIGEFDQFNPPVFTADFSNNYNGYVDVFYLPEPATVVLLGLAGLTMLKSRRRG